MSSYANSISLTISGLIIWLFIVFLCIRKEGKYISKEYKAALIVLFPLIITEFLYPYLQIYNPNKTTLIKIIAYLNIYLMAIETVLTLLLTFSVIRLNNQKMKEKISNKLITISFIILSIIPLIGLFLTRDLEILKDLVTNVIYIDGLSFNFIIYYDTFLCLILISLFIIYRKDVKNLNVFALLIMIAFYLGINTWMILSNKNVNETIFFFAGLYLTIYLTFESQDNQLLSEYIESKNESEKLSKNKTKFLVNMSHQIRTPMSTIMGFSDIISNENTKDEDITIGIEGIHNASKELIDTMDTILDISKIESNKMTIKEEEYDIQSLLSEIQSIVLSRINNKVAFKINIDPSVPQKFIGDKEKLYKILTYIILYVFEHYNSSITLGINGKKEKNIYTFNYYLSFYGNTNEENNINISDYINDIDDKELVKLIASNSLIDLMNGKIELLNNGAENIYYIQLSQKLPGEYVVKEDDAK